MRDFINNFKNIIKAPKEKTNALVIVGAPKVKIKPSIFNIKLTVAVLKVTSLAAEIGKER